MKDGTVATNPGVNNENIDHALGTPNETVKLVKIVRENKDSIIVVMGCMIEAHRDYTNPNVNIIIGNKDKSRVVELVEEYIKN